MPRYRFDGNKVAGEVDAAVVTDDINNIRRRVLLGGVIELSTVQVALLRVRLDFTLVAVDTPLTAQYEPAHLSSQGTWNAAENIPELADSLGAQDNFYRVLVSGAADLGSGVIYFAVGDYVVYTGDKWEKISARPSSSVAAMPSITPGQDIINQIYVQEYIPVDPVLPAIWWEENLDGTLKTMWVIT